MAAGIKGEEKICLVLEAQGWEIQRQYPLQTKYGNGRIDVLARIGDSASIPRLNIDDLPLVIEIKTTTIDQLKWLPRVDHVDQCLLYMGIIAGYLDDGPPLTVPFGEVTYLLKKDHENDKEDKITSYPIEWNIERFRYLAAKLELIDSHVRKREPVPLDMCEKTDPAKPPCAYPNAGKCVYWDHCHGKVLTTTEQETAEF